MGAFRGTMESRRSASLNRFPKESRDFFAPEAEPRKMLYNAFRLLLDAL
jgi:hypothetical protein